MKARALIYLSALLFAGMSVPGSRADSAPVAHSSSYGASIEVTVAMTSTAHAVDRRGPIMERY